MIVIGILIGLGLGCIGCFIINASWAKACGDLNNDWSEYTGKIIDDSYKRLQEMNDDWAKYCRTLIGDSHETEGLSGSSD